MLGMTFVIRIVDTLHSLTVDADNLAGMNHRTLKRIHSLPLLNKALTAGRLTIAGMFSAHHDIPLAAQTILIVDTVLHCTF